MISDKDVILQFLETIKKEIIDRSIAAGQKASGETILALTAEATDRRGILSGPAHIMALENGRGPTKGGSGSGKSLKDRILDWIAAKNITPSGNISVNSLAFLIARKIHQEGTSLYRRGGKSGVISNSITQERIEAFIATFAKKYANQVRTELITEFDK